MTVDFLDEFYTEQGCQRHVCGEYRNAPTIQWALYSGRRAAESVLAA